MIFAVLFFVSFVIGLACYVATNRWWFGGLACSLLLVMMLIFGAISPEMRGLALYFGIPIIFLGSLFGAYIVQLRRAPDLEEENNMDRSADQDSISRPNNE